MSVQFSFKKKLGNNKFELYNEIVNEFSFTKLKDELKEILGLSDISPKQLQLKQ